VRALFARASSFATDDAYQRPPRADRIPRWLSARDIASKVSAPALRIAFSTGSIEALLYQADVDR
jgi:hypothetical protein